MREMSRIPATVVSLLTAIFLLILFLRHDYWNWDTPGYLLFGFVPIGLWWQAGVCLLASVMMGLMTHLAWPSHLEEKAAQPNPSSDF